MSCYCLTGQLLFNRPVFVAFKLDWTLKVDFGSYRTFQMTSYASYCHISCIKTHLLYKVVMSDV